MYEQHCKKPGGHGTFTLDIEGTPYEWDEPTVTMEQIAELGGWDPALGVIMIDKDNNEKALQPGEVVELKPGLGFSKKVSFKRGGPLEDRIEVELALLRQRFPDLEYQDRWVRIPGLTLGPGWSPASSDIAFLIRDGFPGVGPYGIYVPVGVRFQSQVPDRYTEPANQQPPFGGSWGIFSWEASDWRGTADPRTGHNLLNWVLGISKRFEAGR